MAKLKSADWKDKNALRKRLKGLVFQPRNSVHKPSKRPNGMTKDEWAHSVFKPNPKYNLPYPKWLYVAQIDSPVLGKYAETLLTAWNGKAALKQAIAVARFMNGKLTGLRLMKPCNWNTYNYPYVKGSKAADKWNRENK